MTSTQIIDGKRIAAELRSRVATEVEQFARATGQKPGLATVLVGQDPASEVYVRNKRRSAVEVGMADLHRHLEPSASQDDVIALIDELAAHGAVSGILLQLPLPAQLDSAPLIDRIPVLKDVDGLTTMSAGLLAQGRPGLRPCTPTGVITLIDSTSISLDGARAVVVGRSQLVGGPMARLLIERNATVTVAHSRTRDLEKVTSSADVVIAAAGIPGLIGARHVADGALVIDVGIHRTAHGLVGDVRFEELLGIAGWLTPVPGGVGPMTIAALLHNTLKAARMQHGLESAS